MDEKVETLRSETETEEEGSPAAQEENAVDTAATTPPRVLDLN